MVRKKYLGEGVGCIVRTENDGKTEYATRYFPGKDIFEQHYENQLANVDHIRIIKKYYEKNQNFLDILDKRCKKLNKGVLKEEDLK